jgi:glutaminyl-tRNA synthetase
MTYVYAKFIPGIKIGTPGAHSVKTEAAVTWVSVANCMPANVRIYDRLFAPAHTYANGKDFLQALNPDSLKVVAAFLEPPLEQVPSDQKFQLDHLGYFVAAPPGSRCNSKPMLNQAVELKDTFKK